ncbi:MAG: outer membrane beta-barrel protein [Rikenellaceae bacterium]
MKSKFLIYLAIIFLSLSNVVLAQNYVGVRIGMGGGNGRFVPSEETQYHFATPTASISYRYWGGDKFFGGIETGITYQNKTFDVLPRMNSDSVYTRSVNQLLIPFFWQPHIDMAQGKASIFLSAGSYIAYNLSSKESFSSKEAGVLWENDYEFLSERDNRMEYGLIGGLGYSMLIIKNIELLAEARYCYAYSDLLKNSTKYSENPQNSQIDYVSVTVGVYYRFGLRGKRKKE